MTRMIEISKQLGELYLKKAAANLWEWQANQDADRRRVELVPDGGWPGKNDKERDAARDKTFQTDETLMKCWADARAAHNDLAAVSAQIEGLEAERRALEWSVRADLVQALMRSVTDRQNGGLVEEQAFDDTAQQQLDQAAFSQPSDEPLPF